MVHGPRGAESVHAGGAEHNRAFPSFPDHAPARPPAAPIQRLHLQRHGVNHSDVRQLAGRAAVPRHGQQETQVLRVRFVEQGTLAEFRRQ